MPKKVGILPLRSRNLGLEDFYYILLVFELGLEHVEGLLRLITVRWVCLQAKNSWLEGWVIVKRWPFCHNVLGKLTQMDVLRLDLGREVLHLALKK